MVMRRNMADIVYRYGSRYYINMTNRCPCRCTFCVRDSGPSLGSAENLWLDKEPTVKEVEDAKDDIGWGHQIRSYVLDQSRVKDLRTGVENTNTTAVLNGDLDAFIEASLKQGV